MSAMTSPAASVDALIAFYETLSPGSITRFAEFYAPDACFKDPFNEVRGVPAIKRIFSHMFRQATRASRLASASSPRMARYWCGKCTSGDRRERA